MSKIRLHGSSSGYTEIAPVAASGNNTLTLPNDGTIISKDSAGAVGVTSVRATNAHFSGTTRVTTGITTTATITTAKVGAAVTISESGIEASGIGITVANINGGAIGGRRNIMINGAMTVAQRGTSMATGNGYAADRFRLEINGTDENPTLTQADVASGTTPYTLGFRKSCKVQNGNQTGGAGAADYLYIRYKVEAQDITDSGWNYKSASSFITLSFWVKSSVAQNFYGWLRTYDGTAYSYPFETGSLSADTWTKVTKTFPGNSNLQFDNNNGAGLQMNWLGYFGTDYTNNSASLTAWAAVGSGDAYMPDNTSTWYTTNDATFELTGVQLEVGSQATAFEHRSYGEELSLCQRYFYLIQANNVSYLPTTADGRSRMSMTFPTTMRSAPSGSMSNYTLSPKIHGFTGYQSSGNTDVLYEGTFDAEL